MSVIVAAVRTLFGNPVTPNPKDVWPLEHPVPAAFLYTAVILVLRHRRLDPAVPPAHDRLSEQSSERSAAACSRRNEVQVVRAAWFPRRTGP